MNVHTVPYRFVSHPDLDWRIFKFSKKQKLLLTFIHFFCDLHRDWRKWHRIKHIKSQIDFLDKRNNNRFDLVDFSNYWEGLIFIHSLCMFAHEMRPIFLGLSSIKNFNLWNRKRRATKITANNYELNLKKWKPMSNKQQQQQQ